MASAKKSIAIVAFGLESSTFTPLVASRDSFTIRTENFCSEALLKIFADANVEASQVMLVSGTPNGLVPRKDFVDLENEVFQRLSKLGKIDGLLLSMHGSMLLQDLEHGELHFLRRLRQEYGTDLPVSVRLDLHGNVPDGFVELCDSVTALRTAPHRDSQETIQRAARLLLRMLDTPADRPKSCLLRLPILIPGEWAITELEPAKSLYSLIDKVESQNSEIWSVSIMIGFAWADVPWAGASVIVSAANLNVAKVCAKELAQAFWSCRKEFGYEGEHYPVATAITKALQSKVFPLFLMESGDNITAGSTGADGNLLLKLIENSFSDTLYLQFYDPEFITKNADKASGSIINWELRHGNTLSQRRACECTLLRKVEIQGVQCLVLQLENITLVLTSKRVAVTEQEQLKALGLVLSDYKYVVCKLGYLYPNLRDQAPRTINVLSPGPTTPDIFQFTYSKVRRPIFPLDPKTPEPEF